MTKILKYISIFYRWIEYGKRHRPCDCDITRVKFSMDFFVKKFQPEKYEKWIKNLDIEPHPEDPPEIVAEIEKRKQNPAEYAKQKELARKSTYQNAETEMKKTDKILDVYTHIDFEHVWVHVDPENFEIVEGKGTLESWFQRENIDLVQLIKDGVMYKSDEAVLRQNIEVRSDTRSLYKHREFAAPIYVNDETCVLEPNQPEAVKFLQKRHPLESIRTLISEKVLKQVCTEIREVQVKRKDDSQNWTVFEHAGEFWKCKIDLTTYEVHQDSLCGEAQEFFDAHHDYPVEDMISYGILLPVFNHKKAKKAMKEKFEKIPKVQKTPSSIPGLWTKELYIYQFQNGHTVHLSKSMTKHGRLKLETKKLMQGKSFSELIDEGKLVLIGKRDEVQNKLETKSETSQNQSDVTEIKTDLTEKKSEEIKKSALEIIPLKTEIIPQQIIKPEEAPKMTSQNNGQQQF